MQLSHRLIGAASGFRLLHGSTIYVSRTDCKRHLIGDEIHPGADMRLLLLLLLPISRRLSAMFGTYANEGI